MSKREWSTFVFVRKQQEPSLDGVTAIAGSVGMSNQRFDDREVVSINASTDLSPEQMSELVRYMTILGFEVSSAKYYEESESNEDIDPSMYQGSKS